MVRRSFLSLLLVASVAEMRGAEAPALPKVFKAFIGGFMGPSYSFELNGDTIAYQESRAGKPSPMKNIKPTAAQWTAFRKAADEINVWRWVAEYPNENVLDGTHWSLEILFPDGTAVKSKGSNSYPGRDGKANGSPQVTRAFQYYLDAIKALTDGQAFQ